VPRVTENLEDKVPSDGMSSDSKKDDRPKRIMHKPKKLEDCVTSL